MKTIKRYGIVILLLIASSHLAINAQDLRKLSAEKREETLKEIAKNAILKYSDARYYEERKEIVIKRNIFNGRDTAYTLTYLPKDENLCTFLVIVYICEKNGKLDAILYGNNRGYTAKELEEFEKTGKFEKMKFNPVKQGGLTLIPVKRSPEEREKSRIEAEKSIKKWKNYKKNGNR